MIHKLYAKLTVLLLLACSACEIVGVAITGWLTRSGFAYGLWKYCHYKYMTKGEWQCFKLEDRADFEDYGILIQTVRVFMVGSCLMPVLALIILGMYIFKNDGYANLRRIQAVIVLCILAAVFCLIGISVYAAKYHKKDKYKLGWAYIMTSVAGLLPVVVPGILSYEILRSRRMGTYETIS